MKPILDPCFSAEMNRKAMRYLRAMRAFDVLNANLPHNLTRPDKVTLAKRPYLLELTWYRKTAGGAINRWHKLNRILELANKWHTDPDAENITYVCRTQLRVGEKDVVKVILKIEVRPEETDE